MEYSTKHVHYYTNVKHINIIRKLINPFGIAVIKNWQIHLGDAGTIDRFDLAFQFRIFKNCKKRMDKNNRKLNILFHGIKDSKGGIYEWKS